MPTSKVELGDTVEKTWKDAYYPYDPTTMGEMRDGVVP